MVSSTHPAAVRSPGLRLPNATPLPSDCEEWWTKPLARPQFTHLPLPFRLVSPLETSIALRSTALRTQPLRQYHRLGVPAIGAVASVDREVEIPRLVFSDPAPICHSDRRSRTVTQLSLDSLHACRVIHALLALHEWLPPTFRRPSSGTNQALPNNASPHAVTRRNSPEPARPPGSCRSPRADSRSLPSTLVVVLGSNGTRKRPQSSRACRNQPEIISALGRQVPANSR